MFWLIPTASASTFMPPAATEVAESYDTLYAFLLISSAISFAIIVGGMIYFVRKYKRRDENDKTPYITHDHTLEFIWSFIPFVIFMAVFAWGTYIYMEMRSFKENALEIIVYGKKWVWEFEYKNGRKITPTLNEKSEQVPSTIVVPVNQPVKLIMTSAKLSPQDKAVLHSFYIPAFRVKQDVIPGRYTALSFTATKTGMFQVFCTEYCGTGHSMMLARVHVVEKAEFDAFVLGESAGGGEMTLADKGRNIYATRQCIGCHTVDGKPSTGPTWKGLYGSNRQFNGGGSAKADENYIRESIWEPNKNVSKGFQAGQMPPFKGILSEEDVTAVIEFMKTLK